jgi:hypothetical protein
MNTSRKIAALVGVLFLTAMALVLAMNLLSLAVELDMNVALIFALPIILNEILLGIWLIVKGFSATAVASRPAWTQMQQGAGGAL